MLVWLAHHVPQRTIAEWQGLSYEVAAKRATRLRARLRAAAVRFAEALPVQERHELDLFFRRAGIVTTPVTPAETPTMPTPVRRSRRKP